MKLLIVDDDLVDRKIIRRALSGTESHFEIDEVASVAQANAALSAGKYDVIVLDYRMPETDGIEFLMELRARPGLGGTAIVMVSASSQAELALACIEEGAQDFISKDELSPSLLNKAVIHAQKRFEIEQEMYRTHLRVREMAEKDALTGLSNRYHFEESLEVLIANTSRSDSSVALLALDLDNFKYINDTFGHATGDQLLIDVVRRIKLCLREREGFARLGGDEFAIVLGNITAPNDVANVAFRILEKLHRPFNIEGNQVHITASVGAALYPSDATDAAQLSKCADIAMYRAKHSGKNDLRFYEARYQDDFNRTFEIQTSLQSFIEEENFDIVYQPILASEDNSIAGFEALLRWPSNHPASYTPDQFIPIAEESGLIQDIGRWVSRTAMEQLMRWKTLVRRELIMSINVSPLQLSNEQGVAHLKEAAETAGVRFSDVILEVTETALIRDSAAIAGALNALSSYGFRIALDDFGMGFSSIAHLVDYPIDMVKLDRKMQDPDSANGKSDAVFGAVTLMLKALKLTVVAEGIETDTQYRRCRNLKIDRAQGFYLSRPLSTESATGLLKETAGGPMDLGILGGSRR